MTDMEGVEAATAATAAVEAARAVTARIEGERAGGRAESDRREAMEEDGKEDDGRRRGRGGRRERGRVSVLDRLGKTNQPTSSGGGGGSRDGGTFKRRGEDSRARRDGRDRRYRRDDVVDGERDRRFRGGPPRGPRAPRRDACDVEKRADGVVVARAFGAEIIQISATGEVCLRRPVDDASGAPRCDTEVLNAFNSCLNKFGFTASASPADQTQWSLSDGKRLSRFSDGMIVPAPIPPGPGRGLALMLTAPVGGGGRGGRGFVGRGGRGGGRGRGFGRGFGGFYY